MFANLETFYEVTECEIIAPYTLRLTFDDQTTRDIYFLPALQGKIFEPLHNLEFFNKVEVNPETSTIEWPNGADFNPVVLHDWDVYKDRLATRKQQVAFDLVPA